MRKCTSTHRGACVISEVHSQWVLLFEFTDISLIYLASIFMTHRRTGDETRRVRLLPLLTGTLQKNNEKIRFCFSASVASQEKSSMHVQAREAAAWLLLILPTDREENRTTSVGLGGVRSSCSRLNQDKKVTNRLLILRGYIRHDY